MFCLLQVILSPTDEGPMYVSMVANTGPNTNGSVSAELNNVFSMLQRSPLNACSLCFLHCWWWLFLYYKRRSQDPGLGASYL
jgi:hypothetical protein